MHPSVSGVYSTLVLLLPGSATPESYHTAKTMRHSDRPSQFDFGIAFAGNKSASQIKPFSVRFGMVDMIFDVRQAVESRRKCGNASMVHDWLSPTVVHDEVELLKWGDSLALANQCERAYPDALPGCG